MSEIKPDEKGLAAARRLSGWELGYRSWADSIIRAYLNPDVVNQELDDDEVPARTGVGR